MVMLAGSTLRAAFSTRVSHVEGHIGAALSEPAWQTVRVTGIMLQTSYGAADRRSKIATGSQTPFIGLENVLDRGHWLLCCAEISQAHRLQQEGLQQLLAAQVQQQFCVATFVVNGHQAIWHADRNSKSTSDYCLHAHMAES